LRTYTNTHTHTPPPYLLGDLSKVVDEADGGGLLQRVVDVVDVHLALVEQVVEHVDRHLRQRALLLVAEDQVDPLVEVGRHVVALQGLRSAGGAVTALDPVHIHTVLHPSWSKQAMLCLDLN